MSSDDASVAREEGLLASSEAESDNRECGDVESVKSEGRPLCRVCFEDDKDEPATNKLISPCQ